MQGEKEREGPDAARALRIPRPRHPTPPARRHSPSAQVSVAPLAPTLSRGPAGIPGAAPYRGPPRGPARPALAGAQSRRESGRDPAMSTEPELIELRELEPARRAGPGRTRLERANALRIAPGTSRNPARQLGAGRGHHFQPAGPATHTWCDLCGDFIWGVVRKGLQCARE